jgi:small GTP-binding protein
MNAKEKSKSYKVLIMGLGNSGKTSILISLSTDTNILSYCSLKPTKGVNFKQFDTSDLKMSVWDFGGQEQYRKKYLQNFDEYLDKADKIIYVIDVQDFKRYDLSLEFFKEIVGLIKNVKNNFQIDIFLHKYDPRIIEKENFKELDKIIDSRLVDTLTKIIPEEFDYKIYKTSIYSTFEKNLVLTK